MTIAPRPTPTPTPTPSPTASATCPLFPFLFMILALPQRAGYHDYVIKCVTRQRPRGYALQPLSFPSHQPPPPPGLLMKVFSFMPCD